MAKVILAVAYTGYQPIEYGIPKQILENEGHEVITASDGEGFATGSDNSTTEVDLLVFESTPDKSDAFFLIGGPGAVDHLDNSATYDVLKEWSNSGKVFGAICISPRILAHSGITKGKKITGWDGDEQLKDIADENEAIYIPEPVVVDGNIITANGPSSAEEFGRKIAEKLA